MTSFLRVAIVGCGAICGNHIKAIQAAGQRLCALCDINVRAAEEKAEKYGLENVRIYGDYASMLESEALDAVHICTPHDLHAPMAIAALEKGIHVLCEKPLCISMEQLDALRAAVEKSTAQLGVCHQNRYVSNMLRAKKMAEGGVKAGFGSVVWHRDEAYYSSAEWRGTRAREGGGVMINQALHTLDLMQWICGFPQSVIAHLHNDLLRGVIEVEDTASACFICENGVRFNFFATNTASSDLPVEIRIKLNDGDMIEAQNNLFFSKRECLETSPNAVSDGKHVWGDGHRALIADFYRCVCEERPFSIDLEEGGKVIRMILSMYASNGAQIEIL